MGGERKENGKHFIHQKIDKHLRPDCIMLTETRNHKDKRDDDNNFNKIIENVGK